jgi:hypothetical protein
VACGRSSLEQHAFRSQGLSPTIPPMNASISDSTVQPGVNPGVRRFFTALVWYTRFGGSRFLAGKEVDRRGFQGAVNLVLGPAESHVWHCLLGDKGFRFFPGRHPQPLGTVTLDEDLFLKLLSGNISYYTAEMTGKIRVEGDGHSAWILSSTVMQALSRARRKGFLGWLTRKHLSSVLRHSGKGYELRL